MNWLDDMIDVDFYVFVFYAFVTAFLAVYGFLLVIW